MPHAFEFPRMLCSIVPLVRSERLPGLGRSVVNEFVALAFGHAIGAFQFLRATAGRIPSFPAVVRTLNDLSEPAARLRRVDAARINRRTFDMINLPARKMRTAHLPSFARAIRC